jgi:hypothetical protein
MTCKYKDIFGKPNTGAHAYRILNIAIVDTLATFLIALVFSYYFNWSLVWTFIGLLIVGELMHWYFCVDTTVIKWFKSLFQ